MDTQTITKTSQKLRNAFGKIENINLEINTETVSDIYFAFEHFFPEGTVYKSDEPYQRGKFYWNNKQEFIEYVDEKTGIKIDGSDKKLIKKAEEIFFDIAEGKNIKVDSEMKGAPDSPVESNKMTEEQNKEWQEKDKLNTEKAQKVREQSDKEVREAIAQKQKLAQEQKTTVTQTQPVDDFYSTSTLPPIILPEEKIEKVENKEKRPIERHATEIEIPQGFPYDTRLPKEVIAELKRVEKQSKIKEELKTINIVPVDPIPQVELTKEDKKIIFDYAHADLGTLKEEAEKKIRESIPTELKNEISNQSISNAVNSFVVTTQSFAGYQTPEEIPTIVQSISPLSVVSTVINPNDEKLIELVPNEEERIELSRNAQYVALELAQKADEKKLIEPLLGTSGVSFTYLGSNEITNLQISNKEEDQGNGIEIDVNGINKIGSEIEEIIKNAPKGEVDGRDIGFSGYQQTFVPNSDPKVVEETKKLVKKNTELYNSSGSITQREQFLRLHKNPVITTTEAPDYTYPTYTNIETPSEEINDEQISEIRDDSGKQISFNDIDKYKDYVRKLKQFRKTGVVTEVVTGSEVASGGTVPITTSLLAGSTVGATSSLFALMQTTSTPLLLSATTTSSLASGSLNTLALSSFATEGKILFFKGVGNYTFSVVNLANANVGGQAVQLYAAGVKFGNKAFGLGVIKAGGKVVSTGTISSVGGKLVGKSLPAIFTKAAAWIGSLAPGVGTAVGIAIGWVVGKAVELVGKIIPWEKVKKLINDFKEFIFGSGIVALGIAGATGSIGALMYGLPATIIGGAAGFAAGGFSTAGLATAAGGIANVAKIAMTTALAGIAGPILFILLGFPVIVALILFIINSGAYVVPPSPLDSAFTNSGGGFPIVCSEEKGPISKSDSFSTTSPIGNRAWEITYDLYQGFWCFWNRSPKAPPQYFPNDTLKYPPGYPNLFDYNLFKSNPNPEPNLPGNALYWCTWLVVHSYNGATQTNLWVPNMYNDFKARNKIIDARNASISTIPAGSVVFFHVTTGRSGLNHVGVVYSTDKAGITIVQSNAPTKSFRVPWSTITGVGTMQIVYFGTP